jgi:hypothetical protein
MGENICKLHQTRSYHPEYIRKYTMAKKKKNPQQIAQFKKWAIDLNRHFSEGIYMANIYI